ncbi:MAG: orotate phosphoribosyltransferase [Flavobacteriaceae bacterium]|nr:orotate phosphoribosyltransferase [Flavobacteriaceae bacterium]
MVLNKNIAQETVEKLLNINAIKLSPSSPFTWSSGWKSPIYCDNRLILSYPEIRNYVREEMGENIKKNYCNTNLIAGVATGAIGIGALVADYLKLPFVYVRPEAKKHGRKNQIEGHINKNQNVVIIEDLISTGKSSLNAYNALKNESISINGIIAIFDYGFKTSAQIFAENKILVHSLSNYDHLIKYALKKDFISFSQVELLSNWKNDPANWNK